MVSTENWISSTSAAKQEFTVRGRQTFALPYNHHSPCPRNYRRESGVLPRNVCLCRKTESCTTSRKTSPKLLSYQVSYPTITIPCVYPLPGHGRVFYPFFLVGPSYQVSGTFVRSTLTHRRLAPNRSHNWFRRCVWPFQGTSSSLRLCRRLLTYSGSYGRQTGGCRFLSTLWRA